MATELNNNITQMFEQLENFVSTKTVVGEPIVAGGVTMVPLIDLSFGMGGGSAGTEANDKAKDKGEKSVSGLGAKIKPSAMLVITDGNVQLVNIKSQDSVNKLIDMIPAIASKFDFGSMFGKKKEEDITVQIDE